MELKNPIVLKCAKIENSNFLPCGKMIFFLRRKNGRELLQDFSPSNIQSPIIRNLGLNVMEMGEGEIRRLLIFGWSVFCLLKP